MTKNKIIEMARQTGWDFGFEMTQAQLFEFADLVVLEERAECVKACKNAIEIYSTEHKELFVEIFTGAICERKTNPPMSEDEFLDLIIPFDIKIGSGTSKAGTSIRALMARLKVVDAVLSDVGGST